MAILTICESILTVMRELGRPITVQEAYDGIVERGLYEFKAQRPEKVVQAQIRRHCLDLEFPSAEPTKYFRMEDDGRYSALEKPIRRKITPRRKKRHAAPSGRNAPSRPKPSLKSLYDEMRSLQKTNRDLLRDKVLADLKKLKPREFEVFAEKFLDAYGFNDVTVTQIGPDGGIDGHGKLRVGLAQMSVAFQCKRWGSKKVGRPEIDRFRGAIQGSFEQGIFFTTAEFVPAALDASLRPGAVPVILIDGPCLVEHMIEKQFGVAAEQIAFPTYALDTILGEESDLE